MICYFVRHGIAADAATWEGDDADRPLTGKGVQRTADVAETLRNAVDDVDAVVTSPLRRAKQTAKILAAAWDPRDGIVEDERLAGGFDLERLRAILAGHSEATSLVLVGHEPEMSATIGAAIGGARIEFKKGAIACVDFPDPSSARGVLLWTAPPKVLLARRL